MLMAASSHLATTLLEQRVNRAVVPIILLFFKYPPLEMLSVPFPLLSLPWVQTASLSSRQFLGCPSVPASDIGDFSESFEATD